MSFISTSLKKLCKKLSHKQERPSTQVHYYCSIARVPVRPFSGEVDPLRNIEDLQAWLDHFDTLSILNGWNTDTLKKQNLPIYLVGEAEIWYKVN